MQRLTRSSQPGRIVVLREVCCSISISLPATEENHWDYTTGSGWRTFSISNGSYTCLENEYTVGMCVHTVESHQTVHVGC